MNQYFPRKMVNFHNSARSIFTKNLPCWGNFLLLERKYQGLLRGTKDPSQAWRRPGRRGAARSCWGRRAAETEGSRRGAASRAPRRTSTSPALTPGAAWFLLADSGTRSWPGSRSGWGWGRGWASRTRRGSGSSWTCSRGWPAARRWRLSSPASAYHLCRLISVSGSDHQHRDPRRTETSGHRHLTRHHPQQGRSYLQMEAVFIKNSRIEFFPPLLNKDVPFCSLNRILNFEILFL